MAVVRQCWLSLACLDQRRSFISLWQRSGPDRSRRSGWLKRTVGNAPHVGRSGHDYVVPESGHSIASRVAKADRKSVVEGKMVSVRVEIGGRSIISKKTYR